MLWQFDSGHSMLASPAVANGCLFFGNEAGLFFALDVATGEEFWRFETSQPFYASPAVAYGLVFVGGLDRAFYAFDAESG